MCLRTLAIFWIPVHATLQIWYFASTISPGTMSQIIVTRCLKDRYWHRSIWFGPFSKVIESRWPDPSPNVFRDDFSVKRQLAWQIPVYGERDLRKYLHFTIQLDCLLTAFISKNKSQVFHTIIKIGRIVISNLDLISNHYLGGWFFLAKWSESDVRSQKMIGYRYYRILWISGISF